MTHRAAIGMSFHRSYPPAFVTEAARRLEDGGADQLWLIEDCFYTGGISLAAAALTATDRLQVGLGILPAVARNAAVTAMEIATLCNLGPGRVLPGIGHGVQEWMAQMGARTPSPLTTLEEVITAVTRLLAGETVSMEGREVQLREVALDQPPTDPPPVLAGVRGPKSLALAGRVAGGLVLAEPASPTYVRLALEQAGRPTPFHVAVFAPLCVAKDRDEARRVMAPWLGDVLDDPNAGVWALPFADDLVARYRDKGLDGLVTMPGDWWAEIAPVGTLDDAAAHLTALEDAGAHSIGLFPSPELDVARRDIDHIVALATR